MKTSAVLQFRADLLFEEAEFHRRVQYDSQKKAEDVLEKQGVLVREAEAIQNRFVDYKTNFDWEIQAAAMARKKADKLFKRATKLHKQAEKRRKKRD